MDIAKKASRLIIWPNPSRSPLIWWDNLFIISSYQIHEYIFLHKNKILYIYSWIWYLWQHMQPSDFWHVAQWMEENSGWGVWRNLQWFVKFFNLGQGAFNKKYCTARGLNSRPLANEFDALPLGCWCFVFYSSISGFSP